MRVTWEPGDIEAGKLVTDRKGDQEFLIGAARGKGGELTWCLVGYYSGVIHPIGTKDRLAQRMTRAGMKPT